MLTPTPGSGVHLPANRELQLIPDTKVIPPRGARNLMARSALITRLMDARRQRCVVVQGPAGSGKTSTLLAWRRELVGINFDVAWLSVISEDNDPTRLCNCLLASLAEVNADLVREAAQLLGRDGDELALEHWIIVLLQGISRHGRDLLLVIDDLHNLNDPDIFKALGWLLDYAPANLHLAIGTRSALPSTLPLVRLRALGQLSEFDLRDLRFSVDESERYLRQQVGEISRRDAEVLHELTDGWVAGLQLFAIDLKSKRGGGFSRMQVRDASAFAHYFEQEVLLHLQASDLHLLTCASICNRFSASLCAKLVGKPQAIAWMMNQLTRLDGDNLFITQVKSHDRETWYRLHPLLREVLRARLAVQPETEQKQLQAIARDWFFEKGYIDEAVRHAVLAGDVKAAADIVEACAHDLLARGSIRQLPNLLRKLPPEEVRERFSLQLVMAQLELFAHNFDDARRILDNLRQNEQRLNVHQRHGLLVSRGALAMQLDRTEEAWALAPELEAIPEDADDLVLTGRGSILSWLYAFNGDFEHARRILEGSDRPGTSPRRTLLGRCIYGVTLVMEGRISEAEHILRNTLVESEQHGDSTIMASYAAASLLGSTLYEQNSLAEASQVLEPRLDVLERVSLPGAVLQCLVTLCTIYWLTGRQLEAQAHLDRLEEYAQRYNLDRPRAFVLYMRLRWCIQKNQSVQAESLLGQLQNLAGKYAGIDRGVPQGIVLLATRAGIEMNLYRQDYTKAVSLLLPLITLCESKRRWAQATFLRLQLAIAEQGCGHAQLARQQLVEALRQGHRLGLVRSLLDVSPVIPEMLQALLDAKVLEPVLEFYAERLLVAARPVENPAAKPTTPIETLSDRESEVLQLMAQAMTNKKIARILNVSPETVKWHLKNVFGKLGVTGRDEAIAKWRDLSLHRPDAPPRTEGDH
ncbi:LuxR C-terminal-related transcriptional regulator [Pseudomonas sp. BN102]|uniref:LuxR C-terminal-related transcriptional regulator n=1 Tax=Pseudomonas sp. BN102 TaxID=2567886 RepID=UPI0024587439|nr:LuxR C-terminal-related transcriptional regulator [Pseudomonas sp. BN102]MDH4610455.1 LuxR family transcriptional regulator [Pseudomonas sp. BN102]